MLFAWHTDKTAFIRSMTHPSTVHEPSVYYTLTGKRNDTLISPRNMRLLGWVALAATTAGYLVSLLPALFPVK